MTRKPKTPRGSAGWTDPDGADDTPTGYVVNPIAVAAAYAAAPAELDALAEREFATEAGHGADAESDGGS
jgi:hypothetical protein